MKKVQFFWILAAIYLAPRVDEITGIALAALFTIAGFAFLIVEARSTATAPQEQSEQNKG